ncbi:MAG TPA: class A beta-lactamase, subclass A2 [Pyrinomonadaceae bacterium]|jgi:beta-lactamase class A
MKKILSRNLRLFLFAGFCLGFISGCNEIKKEASINEPAQAATPNVKNEPKSALHKRIEEIAANAQGKVGVAATVLETGKSVGLDENGHFPMQSVYKFPIAMAVLKQVEQGNLKLEQKIRIEKSDLVPKPLRSPIRDRYPQGTELSLAEVLKYSVSDSDGTACDVLLKAVGGAREVTKYLREIGVGDIVVATTEKEMAQDESVQYQNWASPKAANDLLRLLHEGRALSESNRALLLRWMTETPTGLKRIKGLLPAGTVVAHKTGTSGTFDGLTRATNDVGLITLPDGRHLAVSIFVSDSRADEKTREEVIAKITRAVWDEFVK